METEFFWETEYTLPAGTGFQTFCPGHLLWMGAAAAMCIILGLTCRGGHANFRLQLRRVLAALLIIDELFKDFIALRAGVFGPSFLPLHLCSINIFLITADSIRPNDHLRELLYAECLPGAALALVFPGWAYLPLCNALCIHSFTAHIILLLYPVLLLVEGFRPRFHRLVQTLPWMAGVVILVYWFNTVYNTNFMFLRRAGTGNPLAWLESRIGSPGYLLGIPAIAALCWAVMYGVPWAALRRGAQKSPQKISVAKENAGNFTNKY